MENDRMEALALFQEDLLKLNNGFLLSNGFGGCAYHIGKADVMTFNGHKENKEIGIIIRFDNRPTPFFYLVFPDHDPEDGYPGFYLPSLDDVLPQLAPEYQKLISFNIHLLKPA